MASARVRLRTEIQAVRQGMRCSNLEAIFATIHLVLSQGIFLTNYVLDLGGSNMVCGIIEALPYTVQFTYFLSPLLVRRIRRRKPVVVFFAVAHRASWITLIILLFVDLPLPAKEILMVVNLLLANGCAVIAGNAWFSWMTDLVPPSIRGSYYGRRNVYLGMTSMVTLFAGSQFLTAFREVGWGNWGYTLCFSIAILSALYAGYLLNRQYEPPISDVPVMTPRMAVSSLREVPLLRDFIAFFTVWQFGMGLSSAFFGVQMVRVLGMSPAMMGYQALLGSFVALFGSRLWGRAMDRVRDRTVLLATGAIVCFHVWVWMLAYPGFLWPIWIATVLGGFSWAGFNLAIFAWPQRMCSRENRQYTYGLLGLISGPAFVVGSLTGGLLTTYVPRDLFAIGAFGVTHFHLVFALSALVRLLALGFIARWSARYELNPRTIRQSLAECFERMRY